MATKCRKKEDVTPLTSDPFVSIKRIPSLDKAALTLSKKMSNLRKDENCFLCGSATDCSLLLGRRHYLGQVAVFKAYLGPRKGVKSCASCLQEIQRVWELDQEIETIRGEIVRIVHRVAAIIVDKEERAKQSRSRGGAKRRRKVKGTTNSSSGKSFGSPKPSISNDKAVPDYCNPNPDPMIVEIKSEVVSSGAEDNDYHSDTFEFPGQDVVEDLEESVQNTAKPVNFESAIPSSSSLNFSRPKRKSRLVAEEILRRTVDSETSPTQEETVDDDFSANLGEPEECNSNSSSEEESKQEPNRRANPPARKKRRKPDPGICPHCKKQFAFLTSHIRIVHVRKHSFRCAFCDKTFPKNAALTKHIKFRHTHETFPCSSCSKELASQRSWAFHEAVLCKVEGWSQERLLEYKVTLHPCPEEGCGNVSENAHSLRKHILTHTGSKPFPCSTCGKSFNSKHYLDRHSTYLCSTQSQPDSRTSSQLDMVLCDICGASMFPFRLAKHKKVVHEKIFNKSCPHCEKRYATTYNLKEHVAIAHEGKRLICQDCGEEFSYKKTLNAHRARVHGNQGKSKTHQCSKCPRKSYTRSDLLKQEQLHAKHGWWCGDCGKNFGSQQQLQKHQEGLDGNRCGPTVRKANNAGTKDTVVCS